MDPRLAVLGGIAPPARVHEAGTGIGGKAVARIIRVGPFVVAGFDRSDNGPLESWVVLSQEHKFTRGFIPMSYAVIKTGGKQYRVATGEKLKIEQIPADVGQVIELDQVLAIGEGDALRIGSPFIAGAVVTATVLAHGRHDKVKIFKMRRRKHYQKRQGHRQNYTQIVIDVIPA
jgi:large subunit ribosomal protein L21